MDIQYDKHQPLYSGKAKTLYRTEEAGVLLAEFRDDTTAFDGAKKAQLSDKGAVNQAISAHIMQYLEDNGVATHFVRSVSQTHCLVKELQMLPLECVVRNIAAGSLCRRLGVESGISLQKPMFELFLKNDELHDPLVTVDHALAFGWATEQQLASMRQRTLQINELLSQLFSHGDMILVDAKFEFGVLDGEIILGDEISPDSCRIWDASTKEALDKDRFRQEQGGVVEAYKQVLDRLGLAV